MSNTAPPTHKPIASPRSPVEPGTEQEKIVREELDMLGRVLRAIHDVPVDGRRRGPSRAEFEADLIALRDQIAEEKLEDLPSLVEQMTRLASLAEGRRSATQLPIDGANPYFAHMKIRAEGKRGEAREQDICIGRRGFIDRERGVHVVDWRDAPVSQVYYRYDEGDDYDEEVVSTPGGLSGTGRALSDLRGVVLLRRNVSISGGRLRRIGCPAGSFVSSPSGEWYELTGQGVALLEGGQGTAARPPRPQPVAPRGKHGQQKRRADVSQTGVVGQKSLPEIAALIDRAQWDVITEPGKGLVVIEGGAGSGKTTVALHRIAYLVFRERENFRPSKCLFVVPSEALARYVSGVLPALGVQGVQVTTFRAWARTLRKRLIATAHDVYADETPPAVSRLKKHPAMLTLLDLTVKYEREAAREKLVERLGRAEGADRVLAAWDAQDSSPPIRAARRVRGALANLALSSSTQHLAESALKQTLHRWSDLFRVYAELTTDLGRLSPLAGREHVEPATEAELAELVKWQSAQLDDALPDELTGESVDAERLIPVDQRFSIEARGFSGRAGRGSSSEEAVPTRTLPTIDEEDDALLLRLYQLFHGQLDRVDGESLFYDHIAVDEAQDLSIVDIKLIYEALNDRRSLTIAGDGAQRVVFDNSFRGFASMIEQVSALRRDERSESRELRRGSAEEVAREIARIRPLRLAYRSTAQVMQFANAVLGPLKSEQEESNAREGAEVSLLRFAGMGEAVAVVAEALRSLIGREQTASVAVLSRHSGQADAWHTALERAEVPMLRRVRRQEFSFAPGIDVSDVGQVKGLEFDYVILVDVNDSSYPDNVEARHLLHIGATRATHQLWVVSTGALSPLAAAAGLTDHEA